MADANIRFVWDNAADRANVAVSAEAGGLVGANLLNNLKSKVWRALTTKAGVVCGWDTREPVGCVVLAFNNFTSQATMQVRGYTAPTDVYPEFDTGPVECAPAPALGQFPWGAQPLGENFYARGGASLFAYGYGGYGVVWVPGGRAVRKLEIIVDDSQNPDGYVEAGRLIVGPWWSPRYNFDFGHSVEFYDSTQNKRTEGGDLRGEVGAKWRRIDLALSNMDAEDRAAMLRMLRYHGTSQPFFVSVFPENSDKLLEQSYQMWGKFSGSSKLIQPRYDVYASQLAMEEM